MTEDYIITFRELLANRNDEGQLDTSDQELIDCVLKIAAQERQKAAEYENNLASTWLGDIKKEFQKEQKRLEHEGVYLRLKPIWQTISESIISSQKRKEIITGKPRKYISKQARSATNT